VQVNAAAQLQFFVTEAWPKRVPDELHALARTNPNEVVGFRQEFGNKGECGGIKAIDYLAEIEGRLERQAEGFFTVDEAAHVMAHSRQGVNARQWAKDMQAAHRKGVLAIRHCDSRAPMCPYNPAPSVIIPALWTAHQDAERCFLDLVLIDDLNEWLKARKAGYAFPSSIPDLAHANRIEPASFTLTVSEAQELLRAKTGQEWPLDRVIGAGAKLAVWLEPTAEHPELFTAFPSGFAAPIIEGGDLQRLAFTRDSGTLTITEHPTLGLIRMSPPASFEADAVRVSQESLEALAQRHEPQKQVTPSEVGAIWDGWKLLDEIAVLLSKAERPDEPYPEVLSIQRRWHDNIAAAVAAGELNIFDAGFIHGRKVRADEMPRALNWCRVSVAALDKWLADMDSIYRLLASPGQPEQEAQAAPDDQDDDEGKRRLDRLRSLGGKVSRKQGRWRFAGIKELIDAEKADNRGRTSDKTIREDLCNAADAEADQKRAGLLAQQLVAGGSR
jgi:hypothetical protein